MLIYSQEEILRIMSFSLFVVGTFSLVAGIYVLLSRALNKDIKDLAKQTARLAQKGLADDISGLIGNVSNLLNAMNQMVLTATGVGVFLSLLGIVLNGTGIWLVIQIL